MTTSRASFADSFRMESPAGCERHEKQRRTRISYGSIKTAGNACICAVKLKRQDFYLKFRLTLFTATNGDTTIQDAPEGVLEEWVVGGKAGGAGIWT
ncbi:hypothetical protein IF1G_01521 [Cordyceps javanica]|uniref:Uncharacterized protein n=1 Tax=Cordyceps javanica TaxID=43265 RepID=A0A545VC45_9HYPO|nr:hypothetical protein IF1G_01521 [Cordyceps javanica]